MHQYREHTVHTYHFDLSHVRGSYPEPYVKTPFGQFPLLPHTDVTRRAARATNKAVAAMSEDALAKLTHYAEDVKIPLDAPFLMRLHAENPNPGTLPILYGVKVTIPVKDLRHYRVEDLDFLRKHPPAHYAHFGIALPAQAAGNDALLDFMADADLVSDLPTDTACGIAFSHPNMCSTSGSHAALIYDRYVSRSQYALSFASEIQQLGEATEDGGFAVIKPSTVPGSPDPVTWNPQYEKFGKSAGDPIYIYSLSEELTGTPAQPGIPPKPPTNQYGAQMIASALGGVTNDPRLKDSHWTVNQAHQAAKFDAGVTTKGLVDKQRLKLKPVPQVLAATSEDESNTGGYEFTINNKTPGYGLSVDSSSITYDTATNRFSIDVKNTYMRTLGVHVRFYNSDNQPLTTPLGDYPDLEKLFEEVKDLLGLDDSEKFIRFVYSVYAIMDIPMPASPTTLEFPWPENAESCDILLGGAGFSKWNTTADLLGLIATAIFQFGVPIVLFVGGAAVKKSTWYKKIMEDKAFLVALGVIAVLFILPAVLVGAYAIGMVRWVLNQMANLIAGLLVGGAALAAKAAKEVIGKILEDGLESLSAYIFVKLAVSETIDAIPFAGWAMEALNIATTLGALGESAGEIIASPATYTIQVTRKLQVAATVSPDPLHGTNDNPAIWPTEATHYKAVLQYKNGTAYTMTGALPVEQSGRAAPVTVSFDEIPSGGQFQITFGVYSNTDWLAGNWTSAWTNAVIPTSGSALTLSGSIIENLVPLSADTQYLYDSKIVYNSGSGHQWQSGNQPSAVIGDLSSDGLNELVAITSNNGAYMLGYTWQAANQNVPFVGSTTPTDGQIYTFQNINTLSDPEASLKFSAAGFASTTFLAYEQFGPEPLFSVPSADASGVQTDLDDGIVDQTLDDAFAAANYPLPEQVAVNIVEQTVEWTITQADQPAPAYQLNRESDGSIAVFLYPTDTVGQNNFYLDSSTESPQLRKVILDNATPFDMSSKTSFGCFSQQTLDAVVIHPANYAVAVSYDNHYLEIVPILQQGVDDAQAQAESGTLLAGPGIREGLLLGPKALAISQDGRILILEAINQRVQAFDINGNPVPCFEAGQVATLDAAQYQSDLNAGIVSVALRAAFAAAGKNLSQHWRIVAGSDIYDVALADNGQYQLALNGAPLASQWVITNTDNTQYPAALSASAVTVTPQDAPAFALPAEVSQDLDMGIVDLQILQGFQENGIALSGQATSTGNGLYVDPASTENDLVNGIVPQAIIDALASVYITLDPNAAVSSVVTNTVQAEDTVWLIVDPESTKTYVIEVDSANIQQFNVIEMSPFMPLRLADGSAAEAITDYHGNDLPSLVAAAEQSEEKYLDMTTEMKGYIYVLGYSGSGNSRDDYFLDLYDPRGHWLSRTPDSTLNSSATGVNASKIAVDMWRNLYSLNYESFAGPGGRSEPSVSLWVPTMPS